ncbi:hypothetical protein CC2G_000169 [Coprinopsis cinerea AmutBmut pab1-1]|nr:hypothetical protein CC2G_000169 [Coprinopsis cinerea AmutBmut pab1-1]
MKVPIEIVEAVVDLCRHDPSTLAAFSLVTSQLKARSQSHLFSHPKLVITWTIEGSPTQKLQDSLQSNDSLIPLIKGLTFDLRFVHDTPWPPRIYMNTVEPEELGMTNILDTLVSPILLKARHLRTLCLKESSRFTASKFPDNIFCTPMLNTAQLFRSIVSTNFQELHLSDLIYILPSSFIHRHQHNLRHWDAHNCYFIQNSDHSPGSGGPPTLYLELLTLRWGSTSGSPPVNHTDWMRAPCARTIDVLQEPGNTNGQFYLATDRLRALRLSLDASEACLENTGKVIKNAGPCLERLEFILPSSGLDIEEESTASTRELLPCRLSSNLCTLSFYQAPPSGVPGAASTNHAMTVLGAMSLLDVLDIPHLQEINFWLQEPKEDEDNDGWGVWSSFTEFLHTRRASFSALERVGVTLVRPGEASRGGDDLVYASLSSNFFNSEIRRDIDLDIEFVPSGTEFPDLSIDDFE